MWSFLLSLILLIVGYFTYGLLVERIFGIDTKRTTPAYEKQDGVDYVPLPAWRIFLIQFLNIAGLGPIFGAIMGIFFGPAAFLWIVFGTIFAGGVHDYLSGMISIRKGGVSLPDIVGDELGKGIKLFMRILSIVLLVLLTTNFMTSPATLLSKLCIGENATDIAFWQTSKFWMLIIFVYYTLATLLPIDKLIGRFYPVFGALLLFMGIGIMIVMLGWHHEDMIELTDGLQNRQTNGLPLFPMMFVSIACGAISGFHGTQSPLMARCLTNERQGQRIFYGAMVAEGILALIWAAAAGSFRFPDEVGNACLSIQEYAALHTGENVAALVVNVISKSWLGVVGGIVAVVGVISASITSGDTALRSARLILADFLHLEQKTIWKRLVISVPMFIVVFGMSFVNFDIVWRYFAWTNQTLATFTLWAGTVYLMKNEKLKVKNEKLAGHKPLNSQLSTFNFLISLVPACFMTMVTVSYIIIAPEGLAIAPELRWVGYIVAAAVTLACLIAFAIWSRKQLKHSL